MSGVYNIKCNDCDAIYIGQRGESMHTCQKGHTHMQSTAKRKRQWLPQKSVYN